MRRMDVPMPYYGWDYPWPNVFEVAKAFPAENWTLVGGLMVGLRRGVGRRAAATAC